MEEDSSDGPFTVWQMFNAPTLVLFNNLEHAADGLDRILTSILKLSGDFSEVLVPRPGVSKCPDSYYGAFNTWLIGRLFYICSVGDLKRIHTTSKEAQLKILNILCLNGASFYRNLHAEYYTVLITLLKYYEVCSSEKVEEITLENFTPEKIDIPNVDINLEHIYVKVENVTKCRTLINFVLELLSESIPPGLLHITKINLEENVLEHVLNAIENFSMDLKYMGIRFFLNLIKNMDKMSITKFSDVFPNIFLTLLSTLHTLVQFMDVLHDKSEIDNILLNNLNMILLDFIKVIECNVESQDILAGIYSVILRNKTTRIFNKDLKLYCLSLSNKVNLPEDLINITDMDSSQIHELSNCYSKQIFNYIQSNRKAETIIDLNENWFYHQVISVINAIKSCEDSNIDMFLVNYHLHRCHKALGILEMVRGENEIFLPGNAKSVCELIKRQTVLNVWHALETIIKQNQSILYNNENTMELITNIVLSTINLSNNVVREDTNLLLQILCFQTSGAFSEHNLLFSDSVLKMILKYLLIAKLYLGPRFNDKGNKIVTFMYNSVLKSKTLNVLRKIIDLCPLMQLNKILSPSKIIGDIMMPVYMTKDKDLQMEILKVLPAIACMSLSAYRIIITNAKKPMGHIIFTNSVINISVICFNCHNLDKSINTSEDFFTQIKREFKVLCAESNLMTPTKRSIFFGLKTLFGKFINMKTCTKIGDEYWNLVGRLCNHYYIFDYEVSTEIINEYYLIEVLKRLKPFIDNTQNDKYPEWIPNIDVIINFFINILVNSTQTFLENNDYDKQASTLDCIKELGLCCNDTLVFPVTKLFIYYIMHPLCSLAPKAIVDLRDVCEFHNQTPNQVYHRYKKDYCKLFVECSLYNGKDFAIYLLKVVRAFGFVGYRDFISKDVHHFLPYLIPYAAVVKEVPSMIEEIATLVQCSVSEFLIERFPHIYVHVYLTESEDSAKKCYDIIEKLTKKSSLNLIKRHFRVILTEFLLQYCINPEKVLDACRYLACHDPDVSTPQYSMSMSTTQIAEFLNPKFLGVLAYFDNKLVNGKVALSVKRKALKSFPDIMQLMGTQYLTPLRFKVLATLRSALPLAKEFPKLLAEAWGAFIHNIDSVSLGPLLSNLAVSLLQQLEYAPQEINKIFQYIILNNENLLSSYISDLFFVEDSKISERIKTVIKKHVTRIQPDSFQNKIKWYLAHLNHDISNLKAYTFSHLNKLLKNNRSEIHKAIFGGKNIEPVIVELIDSLLVGCKDPDARVSLASGACLGQLGAVEAGHLPRQYVQPDRSPFAFSINDVCFAATALVELTRAFQYEKDTTNLNFKDKYVPRGVTYHDYSILMDPNPIKTALNVCKDLIAHRVYAVVVSHPLTGDLSPAAVSYTCGFYHIPVIGISSRDSAFSDKNIHVSFLRTVPPYSHQADVWVDVLKHFNYMKVIVIHSSDTDGRAILGRFQTTSQSIDEDVDRKVVVEQVIEFEPGLDSFSDKLIEVKSAQARVFLMYASKTDAEIIFRDATYLNMTTTGYVWMVTEQALDAANAPEGLLGLRLVNATNEHAHIQDSIYVLASAIRDMNTSEEIHAPPSDCHNSGSIWTTGRLLFDYIRKQSLENGATGHVAFDDHGDRVHAEYDMVNVRAQGEHVAVGKYFYYVETQKMRLELKENEIIWMGRSSSKPEGFMIPTHLKVLTIEEKPFVYARRVDDELECSVDEILCPHYNASEEADQLYCCKGFCMDLLRDLSKAINFTYSLALSPDGQFGNYIIRNFSQPGAKKEWTGLIGELVYERADMIVAPLTINPERAEFIEFSKPFKYQGITILEKKPSRSSTLVSFLQPFSNTLWILVMVSVHVVALVLYLLDRFSPFGRFKLANIDGTEEDALNLSSAIWFAWGVLLNSGIGEGTPRSFSARVLGMVWAGFAMIIVASYTANLAAFLVLERPKTKLTGINDARLRNTMENLTCATVKGSAVDMYFRRQVELSNMYRTMEANNYDNAEQAIQDVKNGKLMAFIWDSSRLEFEAAQDCELVTAGELFGRSGYGVGLQKGSPWADLVTLAILDFHESGIMESLDNEWILRNNMLNCEENEKTPNTLGLKNMAGVFILVLAGIIGGIVLIVIEVVYKRHQIRKQKRMEIARHAADRWRGAVEKRKSLRASILPSQRRAKSNGVKETGSISLAVDRGLRRRDDPRVPRYMPAYTPDVSHLVV